MVIIWGSSLYGRCDEIPGLGHVATNFGHLYYIPLIPTKSHFVMEKEGASFRGADLPMSGRSVLVAYIRAATVVGAIAMSIGGLASGEIVVWGLAILAIVGAIAAFRMGSRASYARACEIAEHIGFGPQVQVLIDLAYDQITEAEANRRMEELESEMPDDGYGEYADQYAVDEYEEYDEDEYEEYDEDEYDEYEEYDEEDYDEGYDDEPNNHRR